MSNGIIVNIDPVMLRLGAFELRWYSLAIVLAVSTAIFTGVKLGTKKGIAKEELYSLAIWTVAGGMGGARLFHVVDQFGYYWNHPSQILALQQGGLAIWGALAGGGLTAIVYAKVKHLPMARLADVLVPAILIAQIIGRLGCVVNGDAYGGITTLPWGFIYVHPNALIPPSLFGVPTHPYPVYEMLWNGMTLLILLNLSHWFKKDGLLFLSYLCFYSLGRLLLTFVRVENATIWGLQQAQIIAIPVLIISLVATIYLWCKYQNHAESLSHPVSQLTK